MEKQESVIDTRWVDRRTDRHEDLNSYARTSIDMDRILKLIFDLKSLGAKNSKTPISKINGFR